MQNRRSNAELQNYLLDLSILLVDSLTFHHERLNANSELPSAYELPSPTMSTNTSTTAAHSEQHQIHWLQHSICFTEVQNALFSLGFCNHNGIMGYMATISTIRKSFDVV
jgi:hypothetical protein